MTDPIVALDGLDGTNPAGFLAALGVLTVLDQAGFPARLAWTDGIVPRARLHTPIPAEAIIDHLDQDRKALQHSPILGFPADKPAADIRFGRPAEVRGYLQACRDTPVSAALCEALVCEGAVDQTAKEKSKPTHWHFTSARQMFLTSARKLQDGVTPRHLTNALHGPWCYDSELPSLRWDSTDDPDYAFTATDPAEEKLTAPGVTWLAFRGLSAFPIHTARGTVTTPGFSQDPDTAAWWFTWALWTPPLTLPTTRALLQSIPTTPTPTQAYLTTAHAWGAHHLLRARITRRNKGYGNFRPTTLLWTKTTHNH